MKPRPVSNPPNPWASGAVEYLDEVPPARLEVYEDHAREILATNSSPDVHFKWSVNAYRGCQHACGYCYARPTHQYLSFGAGTDFETRLVVKPHAAQLLRAAFDRPSWKGEAVFFSGVTDCYQPLEASYGLTRALLQVCADYRNPVAIVTKGALVERDIDLLQRLTRESRAWVTVSVPFFDPHAARAMEPYVPTPARRLQTVRRLAEAGIDVGVSLSPIIPGLNDEDIPRVLEAARDAGAKRAFWGMVRLPGPVQDVFEERLRATLPLRAERVLHRLREVRGGQLNDARFGSRMRGEGLYAETIKRLFDASARRLGLNEAGTAEVPEASAFRRPPRPQAQLSLF